MKQTAKVILPLILGGAILYWMYRNLDFNAMFNFMAEEMDWTWMIASLPFGVTAQAFRGWRWRQTLAPLGEYPRPNTCVNAVYTSYAASLVLPRIGEFTRCGVLKRYDGTSFAKALGTVVTDRAMDMIVVIVLAGAAILFRLKVFGHFFNETGTSIDSILKGFSSTGYIVTAICAVIALTFLHMLLKRMAVYDKVKTTAKGIWEGVISLRKLSNVPLFILLTAGIWVSYILHFYLTFFCFDFTANLGLSCAVVTFVVGSIAVIVPTPNGAGPWHFAVKTMLILYGVAEQDALYFVLIVHTIQTVLMILLGVYGWIALSFTKVKANERTC